MQVNVGVNINQMNISFHSLFIRTVMGILDEYHEFNEKLDFKTTKADEVNSRDTMSNKEHDNICNDYWTAYSNALRVPNYFFQDSKPKNRDHDKAGDNRLAHSLNRLCELEHSVHLNDLKHIYGNIRY